MSGDDEDRKDDELLSQIDELKARMDRLMAGGTSTSNSALLTDAPRASVPVVEAKPVPQPPPQRSRVGDLLGSTESDSLDAPQREAVIFPEESSPAGEKRTADRPEDRPTSNPPPNKPSSPGGSLIAVDDNRDDPRPKVESFDELGTAVEQELARDVSVPPASVRRGPDLASRFGSVDEPVEQSKESGDTSAAVADEPEPEEFEEIAELNDEHEPEGRRRIGTVVAIWVFTAAASGGIAVLHFAGVI